MVNLRKRVYPKKGIDIGESNFPWNYVSNKIWGMHVRNSVRQIAHSSHNSYVICHLHNRPVSSWCNTTLAPPARKYDTTINFGYNHFAIMLGTAGIRLKNSLCRRDYVITRRGVER